MPPRKRDSRDRAYGTLEGFPALLDKFTPPAGDFDPAGAWKHSYAIYFFSMDNNAAGYLEIERRPESGGAALTVAAHINHMNGSQEERAKVLCDSAALPALRSLEFESSSADVDGHPVASTKTAGKAQVRGGTLEWLHGAVKRSVPVPAPVLSNWALFDAVQRLDPGAPKPFEFTLLDDGDQVKPAQRLAYIGQATAEVAGSAKLALHCWEQTGYGVLPGHYWVDGKGRLLAAVLGQKAFWYDPEARAHASGGARGRRKQ